MISYTTFQDVIDHGFDYLGGNPSEQVRRDIIRAALEAYRDLANCFNWTYLYTHSRIYTSGAFDGSQTGATIAYDQTGGQYERMVTLTGGTWPDWAAAGTYLRAASPDDYVGGATTGFVALRVAERKSATVRTRAAGTFRCPGGEAARGILLSTTSRSQEDPSPNLLSLRDRDIRMFLPHRIALSWRVGDRVAWFPRAFISVAFRDGTLRPWAFRIGTALTTDSGIRRVPVAFGLGALWAADGPLQCAAAGVMIASKLFGARG